MRHNTNTADSQEARQQHYNSGPCPGTQLSRAAGSVPPQSAESVRVAYPRGVLAESAAYPRGVLQGVLQGTLQGVLQGTLPTRSDTDTSRKLGIVTQHWATAVSQHIPSFREVTIRDSPVGHASIRDEFLQLRRYAISREELLHRPQGLELLRRPVLRPPLLHLRCLGLLGLGPALPAQV